LGHGPNSSLQPLVPDLWVTDPTAVSSPLCPNGFQPPATDLLPFQSLFSPRASLPSDLNSSSSFLQLALVRGPSFH